MPEGWYWGPLVGTWCLVTAEGSWAGTVEWRAVGPRWPINGRGVGLGRYKNMHIEWSMKLTEIDPETWVFSGEISETSK